MKGLRFFAVVILSLSFLPARAEDKPPSCQVYFSPKDHLADKLIALIQNEQKSIQAAIFCLTHRGICKALLDAKKRGVKVDLVVDRFSVNSRSPLGKMEEQGISVLVWDSLQEKIGKGPPLMHDKFCVFGSGKVWTGSFNFTRDGDLYNEENAIVLEDPAVVDLYAKQFLSLKTKGGLSYKEYRKKYSKMKKKA